VTVADALPEYDVRVVHSVPVDAPPERTVAAALAVTPREAPLLRLLFALRGLRAPASSPIWGAMASEGFRAYDDTTVAAVGQPWRVLRGLRRAGDFASFDEPGWARMAMDFRAEDGRLVTETRVLLTDDASRRAFRRYWLVMRPFSGLVRRSWLAAAKRRAERQPPP
jgi:hypothetical protein